MTTTKTNTTARVTKKNAKAATAKPKTKNAARANRDAKESKPDTKKISQIEAAIIVLGKSKDAMNCKTMVEAMQVAGFSPVKVLVSAQKREGWQFSF